MRTISSISSLFTCLVLSACDLISVDPGVSEVHFSSELTKVVAEQCEEYCRFVTLNLSVRNDGKADVCVPSVYNSSSVNGALYFTYVGLGEEPISTSEPYDPNIFLSPRYPDSLGVLFDYPQYIVRPGRVLKFTVVLEEKFDLQDRPAEATLRFAAFPCVSHSSTGSDLKVEELKVPVEFSK